MPVLLSTACGGVEPGDGAVPAYSGLSSSCELGFLGDPSADPELDVVALGTDQTMEILGAGDDVPVLFPPQGGRVIFAGVRVTNIDTCAVKLRGELRDTTSGNTRIDTRMVDLSPTEDGWGASTVTDIGTFANITVCPNQWASTAVYDHAFELTLTASDKLGNEASKTIPVTPRCDEPGHEDECRCICKEGYKLGEPCDTQDTPPSGP